VDQTLDDQQVSRHQVRKRIRALTVSVTCRLELTRDVSPSARDSERGHVLYIVTTTTGFANKRAPKVPVFTSTNAAVVPGYRLHLSALT
jgi:short-subunit dehydrogenase